jgi:phage shock protein E
MSVIDVLLDVRTPEEFAAGHVQGARNIPVQELAARLEELGSRQVRVGVYCRSGRRSAAAEALLRARGFERVSDLGDLERAHAAMQRNR